MTLRRRVGALGFVFRSQRVEGKGLKAGAEHLALVGPTASGKSELALAIAESLGDVEIVSVDSMQVYRGMDIGTAKPSQGERERVAHHLLDVIDPWEEWSISLLQSRARAAIADIGGRGRRALLVGGSGLHFQAVVDDLQLPGEDRELRREIELVSSTQEGRDALRAELEEVDPIAASRMEPSNVRRLVRAIEVVRLTGRPFSSFGRGIGHYGAPVVPIRISGVWLPRPALAERIRDRFEAMREAGLVAEVRGLSAERRGLSRTARQAIGYKEVLAHLEGTIPDLESALAGAATRTVAFARRQLMWFRRDPRVTWFGATDNPRRLVSALLRDWSS